MRQLATVQQIKNIKPIPDRDRVDVAQVLGWEVIVGKGQYQEGDYIIFCEIDSLFPKIDYWSDLERFKYRIKTFKVNTPDGPIYGQGYCLPLSVLENFDTSYPREYSIGEEVTQLLGITKYEPPEPATSGMLIGNSKGVFPTQYLPKTDETRLESCLAVLEEMKDQPYYISMKIDGSSWSALKIDNEYIVCSRNNMLKEPTESIKSNFWDMFYKYPGIASLLDKGFALQAEIYGEGIQKNHLKITGKALAAFNIFNIASRKYVDFNTFYDLCIEHEIPSAPILEIGVKFEHTFESLKKLSDTLFYDSHKPAEGIVIRPTKEQYSRVLKGRLSFKQISRVFLSKTGE